MQLDIKVAAAHTPEEGRVREPHAAPAVGEPAARNGAEEAPEPEPEEDRRRLQTDRKKDRRGGVNWLLMIIK